MKCTCVRVCVKGLIDPGCDCQGLAHLFSVCAFHARRSLVFLYQGFVEGSISVYMGYWGCCCGSLRVSTISVSFESFRSVASFLRAVESSSAWVNDDRDNDSLYSRAPQVATPAWLKAVSASTFVSSLCVCVCVLLSNSLSLGKGLLGLPTQVIFSKCPEA